MILHINDVAGIGTVLTSELRKIGVPADLVLPSTGPMKHLSRVVRFRKAARSASALHIHYALMGAYLLGNRKPYLVHCHGSDIRVNLRSSVLRLPTVATLRGAAGLLFSTPDLQDPLEREGFAATYLPSPVVVDPPGPPPEPDTVLIFARLDENKGAPDLIEAGRRLVRQGIKVRVVAWGELAEAVRSDPGGMDVLDRQPRDQIPSLLNRHQVVVGQLANGAYGLSELEAMAAGRPVTARYHDWSQLPEAPPLVRCEDSDDVIKEVSLLVADPKRATALGNAGRDWVRRHHDAARVTARVVDLYRSFGMLA